MSCSGGFHSKELAYFKEGRGASQSAFRPHESILKSQQVDWANDKPVNPPVASPLQLQMLCLAALNKMENWTSLEDTVDLLGKGQKSEASSPGWQCAHSVQCAARGKGQMAAGKITEPVAQYHFS